MSVYFVYLHFLHAHPAGPTRVERTMRSLMILALLLPAATATRAQAPAAPRFDPLRFFLGRTEGVGRFKVMLRAGQDIRVEGRGRLEGDVLVLDQVVTREGTAPKPRQWRIRQVAPGRYAGTLTDAKGPIAGEATGDRLHLAYTSTGGYRIDQWLVLAVDGRSALNRLVARRFGVTVAHLDETIRKLD